MILMPRLISMNMDLPDARMYFGLRSQTCCSKCKRRKGRSAFRTATRQSGQAVKVLYDIYENCVSARHVRLAKEKLLRWGFKPERRCMLTVVCDKLLVRRPGHEDEVFPGVDFRDQLHGMSVFMHRKICESFSNMHLSKKIRVLLDRRLASLGLKQCLHDPFSNKSYRVQRSLFTEAHMSAQDRVQTLFYLPHVLGHQAEELSRDLQEPVLTVVACAQIFIISTRGGRSYNTRELRLIFDQTWIVFFGALERIAQVNKVYIDKKRMDKHIKNPSKHSRPEEFQRASR